MQLSYSACERYLTSARSYFLHYLLRLRPIENSSALFFGSAIDEALNALLHPPLDNSGARLALAHQIFDDNWHNATINGKIINLWEPGAIKFSKADLDESLLEIVDQNVDRSWASLQIKGHLIISAYAEQVLPHIKEVLAVQETISLVNESGDEFTGIIDLIVVWEDGRRLLLDNKTSSIKYAGDAVETSGQLSTYFEAVKDKYQLDGVGYIVLPKKIRKKKEPLVPIEILIGQVGEKIINETFEKYDQALDGIKNGRFECNQKSCCSKPWPCSYKRYCDSGGKDTTGLIYHEKRK